MTRTELSQKICEGIAAVFGRTTNNPENWLYEQDYARGRVSITESAVCARDAMGMCDRLEKAIGCGVHVTTASRAEESYIFTIDFGNAKAESKYTDGTKTITSGEQNGKKFVTDGTPEGTLQVEDPDGFIDGLNKVTGSHFRKSEELLADRAKEANLALEGTGYSIALEEGLIRVTGPKPEALAPLCNFIPEGDEYFGSGIENGEKVCVVVVLPPEILGVEELLSFIDNAAASLIDASEQPEPMDDEEWADAIDKAEPEPAMARRLSFLKNADGLSLALSDEKFAQAVASVRDFYGNDKAEAVLTVRLGARMARSIIERLGTPKKSQASESIGGKTNIGNIIAGNTVTRK